MARVSHPAKSMLNGSKLDLDSTGGDDRIMSRPSVFWIRSNPESQGPPLTSPRMVSNIDETASSQMEQNEQFLSFLTLIAFPVTGGFRRSFPH